MKYFVSLTVVGLHLPQLLMAFTASVCTIHQDPTQSLSRTDTLRIPSIIYSSRTGKDDYNNDWESSPLLKRSISGVIVSAIVGMFMPMVAFGVSGGGLDYANLDISNQNFSGGNYKGKDFTQVIAKATSFAGSNLQGCRFYKAYLVRADFSGADLRGASLEDTSMDEASLRNTIASGAYFSNSVMDVKDLENADFTDAQFPSKTLALLCQREDVKGTNPTTGADTRESLMCP